MIKLHINGIEQALNWTDFSDGAKGVRLMGQKPYNVDSAFITCIADGGLHDNLFNVGQIVNIVRGMNPRVKISLYMPYIPYARADRHMVDRDSFGLQVYSRLLNSYKLDKVVIVDPHSDVASALIDNCEVITQADVINTNPVTQWFSTKDYLLVAPDEGSLKKISKVAANLNRKVAILGKERDTATGRITNTRLLSDPSVCDGRDCIIVDDICDGGATFIASAAALYAAGARSVELYVTHGIFSRGLDALKEAGITKIITTDSVLKTSFNTAIDEGYLQVASCSDLYLARHVGGGFR